MTNQSANHVQAYLEYEAIVGGADGGKLMTDKEFEEYWEQILSAPADMELVDDPGDYPFLYVPYQPESV